MCVCVCVLVPVHVDDIIFHMFQYITKLRTEGPQEWVFQECKVGVSSAREPHRAA